MSIKKEMNGLVKSFFFFFFPFSHSPQHTFLCLMITIYRVALILEPMDRDMLGHLFPTFYPFCFFLGGGGRDSTLHGRTRGYMHAWGCCVTTVSRKLSSRASMVREEGKMKVFFT